MGHTTLMLKFTTRGERNPQVKAAARIRVDGSGSLRFIDAETGAIQAVALQGIEEMSIQTISAGSGNTRTLSVPVFA